ncbi:MAG: NAD-dependent epimerase/dehydratase family protein [Chitinophagaceae bacterium]|nr:NAD-dependent epimerase/dehydratase family protein [Chitinophagaceae bacterium]
MHHEGNILVTGGAGLVGSELIHQLLAKGENVKAIYNTSPLTGFPQDLKIVQCNILDPSALEEAMDGISQVYHAAGFVTFSPKHKNKLFKINIEGTANVVNAALDAGVKKIVHVSSVSALGRIREGQTVTEEMNWTEDSSNSIYGKSKYLGELEVWRGISEGLEGVIVNPSMILGGGDWTKGSSEIFKSAYEEFPWFAEGITGLVDVRDVATLMILLMNSEITNQRFILSSENLSYKDIFTYIAEYFGKKIPHKKVTSFLAEVVWRLEAIKSKFTGKEPLVSKETASTAQAKVFFDNSKILSALPGFQFIRVKESIKHTCATLQQKYHLT